MPRSFDDIVAGMAAMDEPSAPAPAPGDPLPAPAADLDIQGDVGAGEPVAADGRMGTGPAAEDGGSTAETPHPPPGRVVDPISGEVLELANIGADALASYVATVGAFITQTTEWKRAAEDELRKRLGKDKLRVFGDWEVAAVSGRGRKWDTEDLRSVVHELIREGVLSNQDVSDLIVAGEPSVNGTAAARLLDRVPAERRPELEACFTWERKGRASVRVTRSVALPAP